MKEFVKQHTETIILLGIIAIGALLRFYNLSGFSLSNDELSALTRLRFDSFSDMLELGVKQNDMHPAGVQIFLYLWTGVFGNGAFVVRLPFILCGLASIYVSYRIASSWFTKSAGLVTAAFICVLEYTILYSQIARPYSPGILFSLLAVWFWTQIFIGDKPVRKSTYLWFVLSVSACMYTHYYCFLFVGIVCFTGLFFLNKNNWKPYIISGIAILLLYLPHLSILHYQMSIGGIGGPDGWLGPPKDGWFWGYLYYCFNDSTILISVVGILTGLGLLVNFKQLKQYKLYLVALAWFLIPFYIGFYYSRHVNPILQYSILIFGFPYFIMILASLMTGKGRLGPALFIVFAIFSTGTFSTVVEKQYHHTEHFGVFKPIAESVIRWEQELGATNVTNAISVFDPYYIHYYLEHLKHDTKFEVYRTQKPKEMAQLIHAVAQSNTPYFIYGWANISNPIENYEVVRNKYPVIVEDDIHFNSRITLFSKGKRTYNFYSTTNLESPAQYWNIKPNDIDTTNAVSGKNSIKFDTNRPYGSNFTCLVSDLKIDTLTTIAAAITAKWEPGASAELVLDITRNDSSIFWRSSKMTEFIPEQHQWGKIFLARELPEILEANDQIKVYIWNTGKGAFYVDDPAVYTYPTVKER